MSIVSSRAWEGYQIDALWEHDWDETPRFRVTVTAPDGAEVGEWVVAVRGKGVKDRDAARRALDYGEEMALDYGEEWARGHQEANETGT